MQLVKAVYFEGIFERDASKIDIDDVILLMTSYIDDVIS